MTLLTFLSSEPVVLRQPLETESTEPLTETDNELLAKHKEYRLILANLPSRVIHSPNLSCFKTSDIIHSKKTLRYKNVFVPGTTPRR